MGGKPSATRSCLYNSVRFADRAGSLQAELTEQAADCKSKKDDLVAEVAKLERLLSRQGEEMEGMKASSTS